MSAPFVLTARAFEDLDSIWLYIAKDSPTAANHVRDEVLAAASILARYPQMGAKRVDVTHRPVRFWTLSRYPNFVLVYRPETVPLQVVAILHGKRDLSAVMVDPSWRI